MIVGKYVGEITVNIHITEEQKIEDLLPVEEIQKNLMKLNSEIEKMLRKELTEDPSLCDVSVLQKEVELHVEPETAGRNERETE